MNITQVFYSFHKNKVIVKQPFPIVRETEKCYFIAGGHRYLKSEIGKPMLQYPAQYPYVVLTMVDADEATLREELSKWFTQKASEIAKVG